VDVERLKQLPMPRLGFVGDVEHLLGVVDQLDVHVHPVDHDSLSGADVEDPINRLVQRSEGAVQGDVGHPALEHPLVKRPHRDVSLGHRAHENADPAAAPLTIPALHSSPPSNDACTS